MDDAQRSHRIGMVAKQVEAALGRPLSAWSDPPSRTPASDVADAGGLARHIDHTVLKPDARGADIDRACAEAREHGFAAVCVNSGHLARCVAGLAGTPSKPIVVVGFPLGACFTDVKAAEARAAVAAGALEVDMVCNLGALKDGDLAAVRADIAAVVQASAPRPVKVIVETGLLDEAALVAACLVARDAGAAFVKTCTGFGPGQATCADVRLMRAVVGPHMGVKASGGVRSAADARALLAAGASRLGASASVAIVQGARAAAPGHTASVAPSAPDSGAY